MPDGFSSVLYPYCTLIHKKCKSAFEFIGKKLVTKLSRKSNIHVSRVDFTEGCRATCHSDRSEESPVFRSVRVAESLRRQTCARTHRLPDDPGMRVRRTCCLSSVDTCKSHRHEPMLQQILRRPGGRATPPPALPDAGRGAAVLRVRLGTV